jgi:hypothetical protein
MVKLLFTIKSVYCFQALPDFQNTNNEELKLNNLERRALEYIISNEFLGKWGFSISDYGEIIDANGTIVLKAATIEAVTKALHNL